MTHFSFSDPCKSSSLNHYSEHVLRRYELIANWGEQNRKKKIANFQRYFKIRGLDGTVRNVTDDKPYCIFASKIFNCTCVKLQVHSCAESANISAFNWRAVAEN